MKSLALIWIVLFGCLCGETAFAEDVALCGGIPFPLDGAIYSTPHIVVQVDGRSGLFLVDYGATQGTLWINEQGSGAPTARVAIVGLPGVESAEFQLRHDAQASRSGAPAGVIGTDVLSRMTVQLSENRTWISPTECDSATLRAAGFRPVDQTGYFTAGVPSSNSPRPNVPILFLRFGKLRIIPAQIDTGYADSPLTNSIDINQPLFDLLNATTPLEMAGTIIVSTCNGTETRPFYRLKTRKADVTDEDGVAFISISDYRLIPKRQNGCGGIAAANEPAAQIGSSLIATLGTLVFDPFARRVWLRLR